MPLQRVPLLQGAYTAQNVIAAAQRCLNLYPEKNPQGEDSPTSLQLCPGLSRLGIPAEAAPVRGLYRSSIGQLFAATALLFSAESFITHFPSSALRTNRPSARAAHSSAVKRFGHSACGSGRRKTTAPKRSSFSFSPESRSS